MIAAARLFSRPTRRMPLRLGLASVCALVAIAPSTLAQDATPDTTPTMLAANETVEGSLEAKTPHVYAIELEAEQFVLGAVNQIDVDVVVKLRNPAGDTIATFDTPARGPEVFQFDTRAAGVYEIEVTPFGDEAGAYSILVERVEATATDPEARVDQIMAPYDRPDVPGGVVAVVRDGEILFAQAYGMANLTHDVPFRTDTPTNIGSTSKQFTAMAIALLDEAGELSLDDDIRTHIPELPDLGHTVTLRHLLTHTSGYREFLNLVAMTGRRLDEGDYVDRQELIDIVQRQPALQNVPGDEWNYNNTAFGLLTIVVERVSGDAFDDWMDANVFEPLGMTRSYVRQHRATIIPHSAQGYLPDPDGRYRLATDLAGAAGAGGIYTTVGDLAHWIQNYHTGELGGTDVITEMTTPFVLNSGDATGYGLGLFIDEFRGLKRIHHGGADTAHRSMVLFFPDINAGVIALSNNGTFDAGGTADRVAVAFFDDHLTEPANEPSSTDASASAATDTADTADAFDPDAYDVTAFDELAGRYELEIMPGFIMTFMREGDDLYTQATGQPRLKIEPTSAMNFKIVDVPASVTFNRDESGAVKTLTLHQNGNHVANRLEDEAWAPDADALAAYTGRYFSEELETFYRLEVEEDALTIRQRRYPSPVKLTPVSEHKFTGTFPVAEITFQANDAGEITGFQVGNGRSRDVQFERMNP